MIRTIFILLFSIVVVPFVSVFFGESLTNQQVDILKTSALIALGIALDLRLVTSRLSNEFSMKLSLDVHGNTPLHFAAFYGRHEIAQQVLKERER